MINRQWVTLPVFLSYCLILSYYMTNRMWVKLHIVCYVVSSHLPWPGCEWHCILSAGNLILFHDQHVGHTTLSFSSMLSHLTLHPMTNRVWVSPLPISVMDSLISWPTACKWQYFFILQGSLVSSHPILTNRWWVILTCFCAKCSHFILSHTNRKWVIIPYLFDWWSTWLTTGCEWHFPFFLPGSASLITPHPMTNRLWARVLSGLPV